VVACSHNVLAGARLCFQTGCSSTRCGSLLHPMCGFATLTTVDGHPSHSVLLWQDDLSLAKIFRPPALIGYAQRHRGKGPW